MGQCKLTSGHLGNFCDVQDLLIVIQGCHLMKGGLLVILFKWHFLNNFHTYPACHI